MYSAFFLLPVFFLGLLLPQSKGLSAENEKKRTQAEFTRNFSGLQNVGYALLREHEAKQLKPEQLAKDIKKIHNHAKNLRAMVALGELQRPIQERKDPLDTPQKFDQSIRRLARLISTFAHNPVHKNRRVFDTDQAQQALVDLETIIVLTKTIESHAKNYRTE